MDVPDPQTFEKLGLFYLGRTVNGISPGSLLLYDSRNLTTHALCVGMTGSGKTGLCLALLEEAAIDGVPALIIDPKGDLPNLLLTFPNLQPDDFLPWIGDEEVRRAGVDRETFAARQATRWREGLAGWGQTPERIQALRQAADFTIYTPGSSAGRSLSILRSFQPPPPSVVADPELLREQLTSTVSSLLALLNIQADPLQSREHILLSTLVESAWNQGRSLSLPDLIGMLQHPPVQKIGVLDLETFYPAKDRFALVLALNNLLASPGFSTWMEGDPLDLGTLLFTAEGKPRHAIVSIAHLNDAERMFVTTSLLNEAVRWMRTQSGTSSLRALLYMDEIFGYFPPTANPPSKLPLLTLLKQARAYGLGVLLATQNPVDLDYKGLGNTGTWFIGRLQTERDRDRVLDGLQGASTASGLAFDRAEAQTAIAGLGNRRFLLHNVHQDSPVLFETRWCMSYLCGPLTREQIRRLTPALKAPDSPPPPTQASTLGSASLPPPASVPPPLPPQVQPVFPRRVLPGTTLVPHLLSAHQITYTDARLKLHHVEDALYVIPFQQDALTVDWNLATRLHDGHLDDFGPQPPDGVSFAPAPALQAKHLTAWQREWTTWLSHHHPLELVRSPSTGLVSQPEESVSAFRLRVAHALREQRDRQVDAVQDAFARRFKTLEGRLQRARQRVETRKAQANQARVNAALSLGTTILSAFLGRKAVTATSISRASGAARNISRTFKGSQDVAHATESVEAVEAELAALQAEFEAELSRIHDGAQAIDETLEPLPIRAPRTRITLRLFALTWIPSQPAG
ncbi:MAG: ATP-binding protein [Candidatus Methylacidiphilales bacterium]